MQEQPHGGDERVTVGTNTCSHSKKGDYDTDFNILNIFHLLMIGRLLSWDKYYSNSKKGHPLLVVMAILLVMLVVVVLGMLVELVNGNDVDGSDDGIANGDED